MDQKISQFPTALVLNGPDLVPLVQDGANKVITAGNLATKLALLGGSGSVIDVDTPVQVSVTAIDPSQGKLFKLNLTTHTLPAGTHGQRITLYSTHPSSVTVNTAESTMFYSISFDAYTYHVGMCVLRYLVGPGWVIESTNTALNIGYGGV